MKTLKQWLDKEAGRSVTLANKLRVSRSALSQVKNGLAGIPIEWMPTIEQHTQGEVTVLTMVKAQVKRKTAKRRAREAKAAA